MHVFGFYQIPFFKRSFKWKLKRITHLNIAQTQAILVDLPLLTESQPLKQHI